MASSCFCPPARTRELSLGRFHSPRELLEGLTDVLLLGWGVFPASVFVNNCPPPGAARTESPPTARPPEASLSECVPVCWVPSCPSFGSCRWLLRPVRPSGKYCQGRWRQEKDHLVPKQRPAHGRRPACDVPRSKAGGRGTVTKRGELFLRELGRGVKTFSERLRI